MRFDLQKMLESKRAVRRKLTEQPVAEKLRMLDILRERELAIRASGVRRESNAVGKNPAPSRSKPNTPGIKK